MGKLFGTDGVRGCANKELTAEIAFKLGRAGAYVLTKEKKHTPRIIIATDTRRSCFMLQSALSAGICSVGGDVCLAGVLPTPAVAYLTRKHSFDAGVVISASHNSFEDNGIKFFDTNGRKLPDTLENEIEAHIFDDIDKVPSPTGSGVGTGYTKDFINDYVDFLKSAMGGYLLNSLKIAIDCANGATYKAAVSVFEELGAEIFVINNTPNGRNINSDCGSTHIEHLSAYTREVKADIGLAFDGDGDRCLISDENGNILDGDMILSICACFMKEKGELKNNTLVATVMSNLGLVRMCEEEGITLEKTAVGDRYVLECMLDGSYSLGGENSGHIIFLDYNTTGDGILTALMILKIMKQENKPLSQINNRMTLMPQVLINVNVPNEKKFACLENETIKAAADQLYDRFESSGRVLIRPSGTESYIRIMIEGGDKAEITEAAESFAAIIRKELNI